MSYAEDTDVVLSATTTQTRTLISSRTRRSSSWGMSFSFPANPGYTRGSIADCRCAPSGSFGNQGAAQAQNLRDSGIPNEKILVANRPDSYAEDAKSKGFIVEHDFAKAAKVADGT